MVPLIVPLLGIFLYLEYVQPVLEPIARAIVKCTLFVVLALQLHCMMQLSKHVEIPIV